MQNASIKVKIDYIVKIYLYINDFIKQLNKIKSLNLFIIVIRVIIVWL